MSTSDKSLGMGDMTFKAAAKRTSARQVSEPALEQGLDVPQHVSVREPTGKAEGIKALRRTSKTRTGSAVFTVILDQPLKARLDKASFEEKVKMTDIARAALDEYLKENGY